MEDIKVQNYDFGRFRMRCESDYAIVDELDEFPPIMLDKYLSNDSESDYADTSSVLHLLNELSDINPNEDRHFYLRYRLEKVYEDLFNLRKENNVLKRQLEDLNEKNNILNNKVEWFNTSIRERSTYEQEIKILKDKISSLNRILDLICDIDSMYEESEVKMLLVHEIRCLDAGADEYAGAWNDYVILSNFFEEHYNQKWSDFDE